MYNFELQKNEETISIFDEIYIKQSSNEKETTIVLTNQRLLFLDYNADDPNEILRIGRGVQYLRAKEVYFQIKLTDIQKISFNKFYKVILKNGFEFEFIDENLYKLLKDNVK